MGAFDGGLGGLLGAVGGGQAQVNAQVNWNTGQPGQWIQWRAVDGNNLANAQTWPDVRHTRDTYHAERRRRLLELKKTLEFRKEAREEGAVINSFKIGCDPEFVALNALGQLVIANAMNTKEIGHDHNGRVVELRPEPAKGAYALVKRLQGLLNDKRLQALKAAKFRAGATPIAGTVLGGHIHFDVSPYEIDPAGLGTPSKKHAERVAALDAVTKVVEHLDILPHAECTQRRRNTDYGHYSDVRAKRDERGRSHFEYRTMASWLLDPKVAFLCLTAAKLAAADPAGALDALKGVTSFGGFTRWIERYKNKDANADRLLAKIRELKSVQIDPTVDIRERWGVLGL